MPDSEIQTALIDLDGTIADYDSDMRARLETIRSPDEPPVVGRGGERWPDYIEARRKLIQQLPNFWRNLPRHELGFKVVNMMREIGFSLTVLTKGPGGASNAWSEKFLWCREHIPDADVTVTQNKTPHHSKCLYDDWPEYLDPWMERHPRGLGVCVAQPWNTKYADGSHPRVIRYDGTNGEAVRARLQRAFERKRGEAL